jgi:hypothetical protein
MTSAHTLWVVASCVGGVAVVVLALVYRRARARHELEEADRIIEQAYADHSESAESG